MKSERTIVITEGLLPNGSDLPRFEAVPCPRVIYLGDATFCGDCGRLMVDPVVVAGTGIPTCLCVRQQQAA